MIIIQESRIEDAKEITAIKKKSYEYDAENFKVDWLGPAGYDDVNVTIKQINTNKCFTFYNDLEMVGWIELVKLEKHRYLINTIVIDPIYDNKGYTAKALKSLEKLMYTVKTWEVDCTIHSVKNHAFFKKLGYTKEYEFMYKNTLPAVRFTKTKN